MVTIIGVRFSMNGCLNLTGMAVCMPSHTCFTFSASSGLIKGSSQTPIIASLNPSKANTGVFTISPQGQHCFKPAMKPDLPVLVGP